MSMASNTGAYDIVPMRPARPRRLRSVASNSSYGGEYDERAALVMLQVLGVLRQGSPPPDVSWRQVFKRVSFFLIAFSLLLFGGGRFGGF